MLARVSLAALVWTGACLAQCSNATLATGVFKPNVVAVDSTSVYFGDQNGNLYKVPKNGTGPVAPTLLAANPGLAVGGIAVDSTNVYYGVNQLSPDASYLIPNSGSIRAVKTSGGAFTTLASGLNSPEQITQDQNALYWTSLGTQDPTGIPRQDGAVYRVAKTGGTPQALASGLSAPVGLDIDSGYVYFGENYGLFPLPPGPSGPRRVAKTGGGVTALLNGKPAYAVAVDSSNLYFTSGFEGNVYAIPNNNLSTAVAKTYATSQVFPDWAGVANGQLFWVNDGNCGPTGALMMADVATGAVTALKGSMNCPFAGAIDETAVYVPTKNGGTIERICRPAYTAPPVPPPAPPANAPAIKAGGVVSAGAFGGFTSVAPGSWMEIYGSNLSATTRPWAGADFNGPNAPTSLDGVKVTIGGQAAFIDYVSPAQVNAQVPSNLSPGQTQVTVTTSTGTSSPYTITVSALDPGLLAPAAFKVGAQQYVTAQFSDGTFVLPPNSLAGTATRQAKPGETIIIYGVGFGPVLTTTNANIPAGQVVSQANQLANALVIQIGGTAATVSYAGLAPNFVGLYQFNVVVPAVPDGDAVPLTFTLNGVKGMQTLYTAVHQ